MNLLKLFLNQHKKPTTTICQWCGEIEVKIECIPDGSVEVEEIHTSKDCEVVIKLIEEEKQNGISSI